MSRWEKWANIVLGSAIAFCLSLLIYACFLSTLTSNQLTKYYVASIILRDVFFWFCL